MPFKGKSFAAIKEDLHLKGLFYREARKWVQDLKVFQQMAGIDPGPDPANLLDFCHLSRLFSGLSGQKDRLDLVKTTYRLECGPEGDEIIHKTLAYYDRYIAPYQVFLEEIENSPLLNSAVLSTTACSVCGQLGSAACYTCSECQGLFHKKCLKPLSTLPKAQSVLPKCPLCFRKSAELPTPEALPLMAYNDFRKIDANLRSELGLVDADPEVVEGSYWEKLFQDAPFYIQHALNIDEAQSVSAFPTSGPYGPIKDPWNLQAFNFTKDSLFNLIPDAQDMSGYSTPWSFVSSVFSTMPWRVEEHAAYSVSYLHEGFPRSCYAVPPQHSTAFEELSAFLTPKAYKGVAQMRPLDYKELFNPETLVFNSIPVYGVEQNPGEFIVTFPYAYHLEFSHGFNYYEAINYLPPEWLPVGFLAIDRARAVANRNLFSMDQLLLNLYETKPKLVKDLLKRDLKKELANRAKVMALPGFKTSVCKFPEHVSKEELSKDLLDESFQCSLCGFIPYFSWFSLNGNIVCLACVAEEQVHKTTNGWVYREYMTEDELRNLVP